MSGAFDLRSLPAARRGRPPIAWPLWLRVAGWSLAVVALGGVAALLLYFGASVGGLHGGLVSPIFVLEALTSFLVLMVVAWSVDFARPRLFFARDLPLLLTMPISSRRLYWSRRVPSPLNAVAGTASVGLFLIGWCVGSHAPAVVWGTVFILAATLVLFIWSLVGLLALWQSGSWLAKTPLFSVLGAAVWIMLTIIRRAAMPVAVRDELLLDWFVALRAVLRSAWNPLSWVFAAVRASVSSHDLVPLIQAVGVLLGVSVFLLFLTEVSRLQRYTLPEILSWNERRHLRPAQIGMPEKPGPAAFFLRRRLSRRAYALWCLFGRTDSPGRWADRARRLVLLLVLGTAIACLAADLVVRSGWFPEGGGFRGGRLLRGPLLVSAYIGACVAWAIWAHKRDGRTLGSRGVDSVPRGDHRAHLPSILPVSLGEALRISLGVYLVGFLLALAISTPFVLLLLTPPLNFLLVLVFSFGAIVLPIGAIGIAAGPMTDPRRDGRREMIKLWAGVILGVVAGLSLIAAVEPIGRWLSPLALESGAVTVLGLLLFVPLLVAGMVAHWRHVLRRHERHFFDSETWHDLNSRPAVGADGL